ncbi:MAG: hypothetical protein GF335_04720 [Candidatus Moranbacteria bacterium]|nr:hypothetical protein [Candidatus Moranbacteria bacterium]
MSGFYTKPYDLYRERLKQEKSKLEAGQELDASTKGEIKREAYRDARIYNNTYRERFVNYRQNEDLQDWQAKNQAEIDVADMIAKGKL